MIYVVWGSTYYFIGEAASEIPPYLLGALRFTSAGAIMLAMAAAGGENILAGKLIFNSAVCGLLLLFADMISIMFALRYISSSLVAVLAASTLVWITLLDIPGWRRNFRTPSVILAVLVGMGGVLLLYRGNLLEQGTESAQGVLIFLCGAIAWSLGSLYSKYRAAQYEAVYAWSGTAWQMLSAAGAFWVCALCTHEPGHVQWDSISPQAWASLVYLVLFGSLLAYSSYVWLLKIRPATEVGTHAYVNPLIAILLGVGLGGESMTLSQWLGLLVILFSLFLIQKKHSTNHSQNGQETVC